MGALTDQVEMLVTHVCREGRTVVMVSLLKLFILSTRTGDLSLQLQTIEEMIPIFHAAGHFAYAKYQYARLHTQQMQDLKQTMPAEEYYRYAQQGMFAPRRTEHYYGGNFQDQLIEQRSRGGLTQGLGITDSTLAKFTDAFFPKCVPICMAPETFAGVNCSSSSQHKDLWPESVNICREQVGKFQH